MKMEKFTDAKPYGNFSSSNIDLSDLKKSTYKQKSDACLKESSILLQKQQYEVMINNMLKEKQLNHIQSKQSYAKVQTPSTIDRLKREVVFGKVRGSPFGACLDRSHLLTDPQLRQQKEVMTKQWKEWREKNFEPLEFPVEGFDHMYGKKYIDAQEDYGAEAAALAAQLGPSTGLGGNDVEAGREYGSFRTPLDAPIGSLKDKWRVLPHFLQVRSLMRQHIDSFDYFVNTEMKEIVQSPSACEIRSDHDPKFYLRYTDCWVGEPNVEEDSHATTQATPNQCRLRDCTYSAPIYVNIRYTRGRQIVIKKKVCTFFVFVT
jgi:hypothetical protein